MSKKALLVLEDGTRYEGIVFGHPVSTSGEVVFSTGMVGYTESLTDPSYYGQILVTTYPLIGNYGVAERNPGAVLNPFESKRIQAKALIVSEYSSSFDHWNSNQSLSAWMEKDKIPGLYGIDTRALTKHLREKGSMLGKIIIDDNDIDYYDPNRENLLDLISIESPEKYGSGQKKIALLDCGCKESILNNISERGVSVLRLPWNWDVDSEKIDGLVISSGPGDPEKCRIIINQIKKVMQREIPVLGICLGHQLMALAAGAETYKLKYGHRDHNQPCNEMGTKRCYITSQNHGYAVKSDSLPQDWREWFVNDNDGTNEGIIHISKPFFAAQFHPEASPGPDDCEFIFDMFVRALK